MSRSRDGWVGQVVGGERYLVTALLGEGGMGQVYRAHDRNIDADVVVKVPHPSMLEQADFSSRFLVEIRSLVRLSHPQIVKVTDVGEHKGLPFAVMQHLPGGDLEARRRVGPDGRAEPVAPSTLSSWLPGVAAALDYIHRERYIHRDVKPANILFDAQGHPFLGDFGVAKVLGSVEADSQREKSLTGIGLALGTPEYMAPELIMGREFDGRVDQYALAISAYEMLCGRKPFEGNSQTAILVRQTNEEPPALDELRGPNAEQAASVVLRALAKDPKQRYSNCGEFARALVAITSRMASPATVRIPVIAESSLHCPACSRTIPIPSAVLAAPERARGRKALCPGCKTPLRFADQGLSLVLEETAGRPAPSTVIAMAIDAPPVQPPPRVARTVPVAVDPGVVPGRRASTVRIETIAEPQNPLVRRASTVAIAPDLARVASTVQVESLSIASNPGPGRPSTRRTMPILAGAVAVVAILTVGSFAFVTKPDRTLARLEPSRIVAPAVPREITSSTPRAVPPPIVEPTVKPVVPALAPIPPAPEPDPAPAAPVKEEAPEAQPVMTRVVRLDEPVPPSQPEPRKPADANKLIQVSFDALAKHPQDYLGQRILPTEMLWIVGELSYKSGKYQRLSVEKSLPSVNKGQLSESPIEIVVEEDLATSMRAILNKEFNRSVKKYPAIAHLRITQDAGNPGSFLGVVEHLEILHHILPGEVYRTAWGRSFWVAVITSNETRMGNGRGAEWKSRISNHYLNKLSHDFKTDRTKNNAVIFDMAMQSAAQMANEANKERDAQIQLERKRSLGGINFPTPR